MIGNHSMRGFRGCSGINPTKPHDLSTNNVRFWFSFVDCALLYRYAYVFVWLCLDMHVMHVVLLYIGHGSCYAVSITHWVAPQHTLGPPVL